MESPYKPALLLAVFEGVEEGDIRDNRVAITPELVAAFKAYCQLLSRGRNMRPARFSCRFFICKATGFGTCMPGRGASWH